MTRADVERDPQGKDADAEIRLAARPAPDTGPDERREILDLFRATYRDADLSYLEQSLMKFRFLATAREAGVLVGFALGESRMLDLPGLPGQPVAMAGICCVDERFRRRGLFRRLETAAFLAAGLDLGPRLLSCGRVAHPASFRTMTAHPSHVPRHGVAPTAWQREVGVAIAAAYGVVDFDPGTFVCRGSGSPIGTPLLDLEVRPEEWEAFANVDRSRGDSLLGLCWFPDAPPGW